MRNPSEMANKLGLPPGMHASKYDIFRIKPAHNTLVFESKIANTTINNIPHTSGGATQVIVVDRSEFTIPVKIGTITIRR